MYLMSMEKETLLHEQFYFVIKCIADSITEKYVLNQKLENGIPIERF